MNWLGRLVAARVLPTDEVLDLGCGTMMPTGGRKRLNGGGLLSIPEATRWPKVEFPRFGRIGTLARVRLTPRFRFLRHNLDR